MISWLHFLTSSCVVHFAATALDFRSLDGKDTLLTRLLSYTTYEFPLQPDGRHQFPPGNKSLSEYNWTKNVDFWNPTDHLEYPGVCDNSVLNGQQQINRIMVYFAANPAYRKVYYDEKICSAPSRAGVVHLHHSYEEFGFPKEARCLVCQPNTANLPNIFYIYNEAHLFDDLSQMFPQNRHVELPPESYSPKTATLPFLAHMIHLSIDGHFRLRYPVFAQFGRMTAVQTVKEQDRQLLEADTGDIWTMPFNDDDWRNFPKKRVDYEDMQMINRDLKTFSLITTCAQVFDDEIRGTGVFTVQDSLIRSDIYKSGSGSNIMEYREYEEVSTHGFFRTTQIVEFNLEVFIRFDEWSCCSACCCSEVMCGDMATEDKCDQVFSTKSRKGYLSIRKLNHTLPISTPCPASTSQKLDHMLSMSSYNETGIALFSSILYTLTNGKDCGVVDFREQILVKVLEVQNVNPANFTYSGRGLVLESQTCNDDPQKKDCMLLAKCRGMQLKESYWEKKEEVDGSDPCEGIDFIEILLRDEDIEYKAKKGPNFKVSLDPDFYDENSTSVRYRVAHIFAFPYDLRKSCMEQKGYVVHPNYKDLIILGITRSDMNRKIEVSFADSDKRIKVRFKDESERGGIEGVNRSELVMWCSLIILFFLMLVGLVVFMAYEKSARTKTALKIKKKEQNDFTFKLPIKSVSKLSSEESSNERAILPTSKPVPVPILSPKTPPIPRN